MKSVESFYDANPQMEWDRFERHAMEFAITKRALAQHLPPPPARILDCGGGPGRYAIHLARMGYEVTLLDLSQANLDLARVKAGEAQVELAAYIHGNALEMAEFSAGQFDAVLLLGPLYHLLSDADRRRAVSEARRVLRPGGRFFAAFITFYAPFRDAIAQGYLRQYFEDQERTDRLLENHTVREGFTDAWCALPAEVTPWMESCGLRTRDLLAVEGLAAGHERFINALDAPAFDYWVELNERFCRDPHLLGGADHLLYVGE